jgi:hypothetical protein
MPKSRCGLRSCRIPNLWHWEYDVDEVTAKRWALKTHADGGRDVLVESALRAALTG